MMTSVTIKVNLNEYIHPNMDVLFVALKAPNTSNSNAHWFSNNLSFWNVLFKSGLITQPIWSKLEGDIKVFSETNLNYKNWNIGVTDLNRRIVKTDSRKIKYTNEDVKGILNILNDNRYGLIGTYNNTKIYEVPFHNAAIPSKEKYYPLLLE